MGVAHPWLGHEAELKFVPFFKTLPSGLPRLSTSKHGEAEGLARGCLLEDLAIVIGRIDVVLGQEAVDLCLYTVVALL
jgi:hypothetical protein